MAGRRKPLHDADLSVQEREVAIGIVVELADVEERLRVRIAEVRRTFELSDEHVTNIANAARQRLESERSEILRDASASITAAADAASALVVRKLEATYQESLVQLQGSVTGISNALARDADLSVRRWSFELALTGVVIGIVCAISAGVWVRDLDDDRVSRSVKVLSQLTDSNLNELANIINANPSFFATAKEYNSKTHYRTYENRTYYLLPLYASSDTRVLTPEK